MKKFDIEGFIPVSFSFEKIEAQNEMEARKKAFKLAEKIISASYPLECHTDEGEITYTSIEKD